MVSRVVVSACLVGVPCAYHGRPRTSSELLAKLSRASFLPLCPEALVGLGIPRYPAEIRGGDGFEVLSGKAQVRAKNGDDLTSFFLVAAEKVLEIVTLFSPEVIYFCEGSPSCGVNEVYDGSFSGIKRRGTGVCAALLRLNGFRLIGWREKS